MRRSLDLLLLFLAVVAFASCLAQTIAAQETPAKMTHLIVQLSGDEVPPDSFAAKPKTMWRASSRFCRVDELPDPEQGIHGSMIINEPDVWMVNHIDKSARHIVDQGPTFNCRLPIFANDAETLKTKIGELEFGNEINFFLENGAELVPGPKLSFEAKFYNLKIGATTLLLVERVDIHAPIRVAMIRDGKAATFTYKLWEQSPFDQTLFSKPQGLTIHEN
jgi:hypothetical protein